MSDNVFQNQPEILEELHHIWDEAPHTKPRPIGLKPSFGFGDRVGGATDGHIQSLRDTGLEDKVAGIFAQQSAREMMRTGRTPAEVMHDAVHCLEQNAWTEPWGADADHMKSREQVNACIEAGFTLFTADPSDAVNDEADNMSDEELKKAAADFEREHPEIWDRWCRDLQDRELKFQLNGEDFVLKPTLTDLRRVAVKLGRAILLAVEIDSWIKAAWKKPEPYDFEISVDETASPTSLMEHLVVVSELHHRNIRLTALAPRFVGDFEKAIDYIGDLEEFRENICYHAAMAKKLGRYKISVHSGSDKFSIYPICHEECGDLLHVKTAGTSYLEALRVLAKHAPLEFREIAKYSFAAFAKARATYHLSTDTDKFPDPDKTPDNMLAKRFLDAPEANDARQILHVAFGEVIKGDHNTIAEASKTLKQVLHDHHSDYREFIAAHFKKHMTAFGARA